jgi:HEAT repeat protein
MNVIQRLRNHQDARTSRRRATGTLGQPLLLRLLPALRDVPLPLVDPSGTPTTLGATLQRTAFVTLSGQLGSGRGLALWQQAQRWGEAESGPLPAPLALPLIDDDITPPEGLIALHLERSRSSISRIPFSDPASDLSPWGVLVEGWEELPPPRREVWRSLLQQAPQRWPDQPLVVALPADEPAWPGFTALRLQPPDTATVARWLDLLAPSARREALLAALAPSGPLGLVSERPFELALLLWVAGSGRMPAQRAQLYEQALRDLLAAHPEARLTLAQLQALAAYGEPPGGALPGLIDPTPGGEPRLVSPLIRAFLAARQLGEERRYDLLDLLPPQQRAEVARFAAANDPGPIYGALWRGGRPDADSLLALGQCLRERRPSNAAWTLRIIGALGVLTRDPLRSGEARALLDSLRPALDDALELLLAHGDHATQQALPRLLELLPNDLLARAAARCAYHPAITPQAGWALADLLLRSGQAEQIPALTPDQPRALARWTYVQIMAGPQSRLALAGSDGRALAALVASDAGELRLLHAASSLADDHELPSAVRIAGLELLRRNSQPTALTVIDRACHDEDSLLRQAALGILAARDPDRAGHTLSRIALDRSSPAEARIAAVERLAALADESGLLQLARMAGDAGMPLYGRLLCISALGQMPAAGEHLQGLLRDTGQRTEIRGAAARALGQLRYTPALPIMLSLLNGAATPPALAEGVAAGLGMFDNAAAMPQLLGLLEQSASEFELTLATIAALGELGGFEAVEPLSSLLGDGALARLLSTIPDLDPQRLGAAPELGGLPNGLTLQLEQMRLRAETNADVPTTLGEFLSRSADSIRAAAAQALSRIGGNNARAALLAVLLDGGSGGATDAIISALAEEDSLGGTEALGYLLTTAEADPMVRWRAVQRLQQHPNGDAVLLRAFKENSLDPFTRGALAEALGQRHVIDALPLLRHLADDPATENHLRAQVILALGLLDDPATESTLLSLLNNAEADPELRGLAAENLPSGLSDESRRLLRDLLRRERPPAPLVAGALRALARARDREAIPLLLRYSQDDPPSVAQAALIALRELGDDSVAPVLVRVAQNTSAEQATRLQAVGTLLKIGGEAYQPLLRIYLDYGTLPMRLQALEHLLDANPLLSELLAGLHNRSWPTTMRLRLLQHCARLPEALPALRTLLDTPDEERSLRWAAAHALTQTRDRGILPICARLALDPAADPTLRLRCVDALGQLAAPGDGSGAVLSQLTDNPEHPPVVRAAALRALQTALQQRTVWPPKS